MDGNTTVKYLQNYIRAKDFQPYLVKDYFIKLSEEVGELARAIRKLYVWVIHRRLRVLLMNKYGM